MSSPATKSRRFVAFGSGPRPVLRRSRPSFTAIGFAMASRYYTSACAIGAVQVREGQIVARAFELIRPSTRVFDLGGLHGITWDHVREAPTFDEVWLRVAPLLHGSAFLAAHNAPFHAAVLEACCAQWKVPTPELPFECTVRLARERWNLWPTTLRAVADRLGLDVVAHHAGSEAEACARIVLEADARDAR